LAGQIVREIEPHSEADPVAILAQLLAATGSAVGRGPGFKVEADRHYCNLFIGIVGDTSSARKGSSWGQAKRLIEAADASWGDRIATGASSGEGLIWQVRNPIGETRKARKGENGDEHGFVTELVDAGVGDKRLLVVEPELASVLERMQREGNTLSAVLRQAWDGGKLDTLVKSNRATATDAHVSVIGHITVEELRRKLSATEQANGFANRFIWLYVTRSKFLPFGGEIDSVDWEPYVGPLREAIRFGSTLGPLDMDPEARQLWEEHYQRLCPDRAGLQGTVTARGAAQVRRLAVIYALLDLAPTVTANHLRAALALWDYSLESAAIAFGDSLGDPTADAILARLRSKRDGMTRTEISNSFGRHREASEIERALSTLIECDLARNQTETGGKGRPPERWYASENGELGEGTAQDDGHSSLDSHPSQGEGA
jgi:hypothetical protein